MAKSNAGPVGTIVRVEESRGQFRFDTSPLSGYHTFTAFPDSDFHRGDKLLSPGQWRVLGRRVGKGNFYQSRALFASDIYPGAKIAGARITENFVLLEQLPEGAKVRYWPSIIGNQSIAQGPKGVEKEFVLPNKYITARGRTGYRVQAGRLAIPDIETPLTTQIRREVEACRSKGRLPLLSYPHETLNIDVALIIERGVRFQL